ncbi:MepB family protein, partial [Enterococcus faecalis]
ILKTNQQKCNMAERFYPSWCQNLNKTAKKTQNWQLAYFTDLSKY